MSSLVERFVRYVKINTQSAEGKDCVPSTPCQHDLAKVLGDELRELGLEEVEVTENAYVYGILPANIDLAPAIGLCAHIDTALEVTDENVKPRIVENYDGGNLVLNAETNVVLSPSVFPELSGHKGETLIVTNKVTATNVAKIAAVKQLQGRPWLTNDDFDFISPYRELKTNL